MKVLVVEDEIDMAVSVSRLLGSRGWQVAVARGFEDAIQMIKNEVFDICLLDLYLGDGYGEELIEVLEQKHIPVIVLTVVEDTPKKVKCLRLGADDYVVKPFDPEELIARIEAVIRRIKGPKKEDLLRYKDMEIDPFSMSLRIQKKSVYLPRKQIMLLIKLVENAESIVPYETLLSYAWGSHEEACMESLRTHVHKLRKVLREFSFDILSYPGIGYMLKYIA